MINLPFLTRNTLSIVPWNICVYCILGLFFTMGCKNDKTYTSVLEHFKNDSLKFKAAQFLIQNIDNKQAIIRRYKDANNLDASELLKSFNGGKRTQYLDSAGIYSVLDTLSDLDTVDPDYLIKQIEEAFSVYNNNPLKVKVPFNVFCNYVLPYRVGTAELSGWRNYFNKRYMKYINSFDRRSLSEGFLLEVLSREQKMWYNPYNKFGIASFPSSPNQSLKDIMDTKYPYSCEDYAVYYLYLYRSIGLPAAYEVIPLFGKFNYGHAETAVMFNNGKFEPARLEKNPFKYQIAKMYRRTFERSINPYTLIKNEGNRDKDIPEYFNHDDLIDITNERTEVSNVTISYFASGASKSTLYLSVYNDGEWKPVEWAKLDKASQSFTFKNMGRKILYHLSQFENGSTKLLAQPFLLDSLGNTKYLSETNNRIDITLLKSDRKTPISSGKKYTLKMWNAELKKWSSIAAKIALTSEIKFVKVPESVLFLLEETRYEGAPVRPFTINSKGEQIWW